MKKVFRSPNFKPLRPSYIERHLEEKEEDDRHNQPGSESEFQMDGKFGQPPVTPSNVLYLQKTLGNQAVQRMLKQSSPAIVQRAGLTTEELDKIKKSSSNARNFWQTQAKGGDKNPIPVKQEKPQASEGASKARQFWSNMSPGANLKNLTAPPEQASQPKKIENLDLDYWEEHNINEPIQAPGEVKGEEPGTQPESNYKNSSPFLTTGGSNYSSTATTGSNYNKSFIRQFGGQEDVSNPKEPDSNDDDISFSDDDTTYIEHLKQKLEEAIAQAEEAGKIRTQAAGRAKTATEAAERATGILAAAKAKKNAPKESPEQPDSDDSKPNTGAYGAYGSKSDSSYNQIPLSQNYGSYNTASNNYSSNQSPSTSQSYTTVQRNTNYGSFPLDSNYTTTKSNDTPYKDVTFKNEESNGNPYKNVSFKNEESNGSPYKNVSFKNEESSGTGYKNIPFKTPSTPYTGQFPLEGGNGTPLQTNKPGNYNSSTFKDEVNEDLSFSDDDDNEVVLDDVPEKAEDSEFATLDLYVNSAIQSADDAARPENDIDDIKDYCKAARKWARFANECALKIAHRVRKAENTVDEVSIELGKQTAKLQGKKNLGSPDLIDVGKKNPVRYGTTKLLEEDIGEEQGLGEGNAGRKGIFKAGVDKQTKYLDKISRKPFQFTIDGGLFKGPDGKPLDSSNMAEALAQGSKGGYIFVMTRRGKFYFADAITEYQSGIADYEKGKTGDRVIGFHHSSFKGGGAVAGAGEVHVVGGKLVHVTDASGHYKPNPEFTYQVLLEFQRLGVDISQVKVFSYHIEGDEGMMGTEFLKKFKGQYKELRKKTNWMAEGEKFRAAKSAMA